LERACPSLVAKNNAGEMSAEHKLKQKQTRI
jgi:hypothetical protein